MEKQKQDEICFYVLVTYEEKKEKRKFGFLQVFSLTRFEFSVSYSLWVGKEKKEGG